MHDKQTGHLPSIFLLIALISLPLFSETIYSPALPMISHDLKSSMYLVEWSLSVYLVGFALGSGIWGVISDRLGRKPTILIGLTIYLVASLLCATFVKTIDELLVLRMIQALGVSVASVVTQTIMREVFDGERRSRVFSVIGLVMGVVPAIGPFVGGLIVEHHRWQGNFSLLALLGFLLMLFVVLRLPETRKANTVHFKLALLKNLLTDKLYIGSALLIGCLTGTMYSFYAHAPFIFINVLSMEPSHYGLLFILLSIGASLGSFISVKAGKRYTPEAIVNVGVKVNVATMCFFVIAIQFTAIHHWAVMLMVLAPIFIFFVLLGLCSPNILTNAMVNHTEYLGAAGSVFGLLYYGVVSAVVFGMGLVRFSPVSAMAGYFLFIALIMLAAVFLSGLGSLRLFGVRRETTG